MSVAPLPPALERSSGEPPEGAWPSWIVPPVDGFTSADLDRLPGLRAAAPDGWRVTQEMTAWLDDRNRPEPDIMVVAESAMRPDMTETSYRPEDIALAIEVVSPESVERDHEVKPKKYARAGIKHLWLIERDGEAAVAYVHALDPLKREYVLLGTYRERLKVSVPFDIDVDFATLDDYE